MLQDVFFELVEAYRLVKPIEEANLGGAGGDADVVVVIGPDAPPTAMISVRPTACNAGPSAMSTTAPQAFTPLASRALTVSAITRRSIAITAATPITTPRKIAIASPKMTSGPISISTPSAISAAS